MSPELEKVVNAIRSFNWIGVRQPARRIGIARRFTLYRTELEDRHLLAGIYHKPITYKKVICDRLPKFDHPVDDSMLMHCQGELDEMYQVQDELIAQFTE